MVWGNNPGVLDARGRAERGCPRTAIDAAAGARGRVTVSHGMRSGALGEVEDGVETLTSELI